MGLLFWDGLLRGGAGALFVLLASLFGRDWNRSLTAKLGTLLALSGACYVAITIVDSALRFPWWRLPLHLMSLAAPALFWLFASSWFDDDFALRRRHIVWTCLTMAAGAAASYGFLYLDIRILSLGLGWRAISIVLVGLGIRTALRERKNDLVEPRRRARLVLSVVVGLVIMWVVLAELQLSSWPPPPAWRVVNAASLFGLAMTVAGLTLGWRDPALLAPVPRPVAPTPDAVLPDDSMLLARLEAEMTRERLYRQDGLTITAVAARLGVPEYRLRRAINQGLGARNFNAYLNSFRVGEAADALADAGQRDVPILTIALDAGFGSLAPFNRAFRGVHGCTPTEYRVRSLLR